MDAIRPVAISVSACSAGSGWFWYGVAQRWESELRFASPWHDSGDIRPAMDRTPAHWVLNGCDPAGCYHCERCAARVVGFQGPGDDIIDTHRQGRPGCLGVASRAGGRARRRADSVNQPGLAWGQTAHAAVLWLQSPTSVWCVRTQSPISVLEWRR